MQVHISGMSSFQKLFFMYHHWEIVYLSKCRNSPTISTTSKPQSPSVTANKKDLSGPLLFNTPIPSSAGTRLILRNPDHLVIDPIMFNNMMYHVLRLSPPSSSESPPIQTAYDLILPVASAFDSQAYPIFTTTKCTWQYVFENVTNPSELWLSYAPGNLGDYADIKSIWEAWDEGTFVTSIGRKAPIRLIDARWGNLKNEETHRKKYASWRRNLDTTVCVFQRQFLLIVFFDSDSRDERCGLISFSLSSVSRIGEGRDTAHPMLFFILRISEKVDLWVNSTDSFSLSVNELLMMLEKGRPPQIDNIFIWYSIFSTAVLIRLIGFILIFIVFTF